VDEPFGQRYETFSDDPLHAEMVDLDTFTWLVTTLRHCEVSVAFDVAAAAAWVAASGKNPATAKTLSSILRRISPALSGCIL